MAWISSKPVRGAELPRVSVIEDVRVVVLQGFQSGVVCLLDPVLESEANACRDQLERWHPGHMSTEGTGATG